MSLSGELLEIKSPDQSGRLLWWKSICALALLLAFLIGFNWQIVKAAVTVWWVSPTYSHCFFIAPISAFLIWGRRRELVGLVPQPNAAVLVLALPLIGIQLIGTILSITEMQQFALVGLAEVFAAAVLGKEIYRRIQFPMLYLFFLIPTGEYLVAPMQLFTTWFVSAGLTIMGVLHHTEGTVIELVGGSFRVAEACAGLRFLIATIAIGALFCYLNFRNWYKIAVYMLASAIVPVIANGFRALGIVLLAHYSNNRIATGADHLVYGWGFSVAILSLLMFIGVRVADTIEEKDAYHGPDLRHRPQRGFIPVVTFLAIAMTVTAPAFAYWNNHRAAGFDVGALSNFAPSGDWNKIRASNHWAPNFAEPDAAVTFGLQNKLRPMPAVDVAVYYYARTRNGHGLVSSTNSIWTDEDWHALERATKHVHVGGRDIVVEEVAITSRQRTELIWWTYWAHGKFTTSPMTVKLASLETLIGAPGGSALVAFSTDIDSDIEHASARLNDALAGVGGIPHELELAAGQSKQP